MVFAKMVNAVSSSMAYLVAHGCSLLIISFIITEIENTQVVKIEAAAQPG